jgi:ribosomal-protein-alanine N-acetyltransferase
VNPPPDTFSTARLVARRPRLEDAPAIFAAYAADPEATRYLTWVTHGSVDTLRDYLRLPIADWDSGAGFRYELCLQGSDNPVGSLHLRPEGTRVIFGYVLARPLWGRGLMAEALRFGVDWALAQPGVFRASAYCDVENPSSARVMEKAGMTREGILRRYHTCPNLSPEPRDCLMYAKVR